MSRQHDAELCERIRALEERVKELEAAPRVTYITYPSYPVYPYTVPWYGTTSGDVSVGSGSTSQADQFTYTLENPS